MPMPAADVAVVVPVHNARTTVADLVAALLSTARVAVDVVLVDDASTDGSGELVARLAREHDRVTGVHLDSNSGAGHARNRGFEEVSARYTLFFDADDVVHVDVLEALVVELDASGADLAMTTYAYQRGDDAPNAGMHDHDDWAWHRAMPSNQRWHTTTLGDAAELLGFTNYPWNKIIRTSRYRSTGLEFGAGRVHNDILGHWHMLLFARSLLLFDDPLCTHVVTPGGANLTNQQSAVRLQLLDALDETYDLLEVHPALLRRYAHHYWSFVLRVAAWARGRVTTEFRGEFDRLLGDHLLRIDPLDYVRIRLHRNPALATDLLKVTLR